MMLTMRYHYQFNTKLAINVRSGLNSGALESWLQGDTSPASAQQRAVRPTS